MSVVFPLDFPVGSSGRSEGEQTGEVTLGGLSSFIEHHCSSQALFQSLLTRSSSSLFESEGGNNTYAIPFL